MTKEIKMADSKYTIEYDYKKAMQIIRNLRDTIDGELNRIAVTDNPTEIQHMLAYLHKTIEEYAEMNTTKLNERKKANHD